MFGIGDCDLQKKKSRSTFCALLRKIINQVVEWNVGMIILAWILQQFHGISPQNSFPHKLPKKFSFKNIVH